ncbi:MAG: tRNA 2-selenouridine(34) synthase MnmH [Thermodesulfobacteriota bacterium]
MQVKTLETSDFLKKAENSILIDVRSPVEYTKGHIPGALNIPLFSDKEREDIGILYKHSSKKDAVLKGISYVQPKLSGFVEKIYSLTSENNKNKILVYCHRGGLRSNSFAWLLEASGFDVSILESGYKKYRNHVLQSFKNDYKFILLGGKTGCGKTDILKEMEKNNEQVIDLEGIANHKGSAFGDLGNGGQPTPQQFENNLSQKLTKLDIKKHIWLENESAGIGGLFIPLEIRNKMQNAPVVDILLPKNERIKRIAKEYGSFNKILIEERIKKIEKRLGRENAGKAVFCLHNNRINETVELLIGYYDKSYDHSTDRTDKIKSKLKIKLDTDNPVKNSKIILETVNSTETALAT